MMMLSEGQTYAEAYHIKGPTPSLEADLTQRLQARYRLAVGAPATLGVDVRGVAQVIPGMGRGGSGLGL